MLTSSTRLKGVEASEIENGSLGGVPATRFRYKGKDEDGHDVEGVYYLWRAGGAGPIWNVVAEGLPDKLPLLEAAVLTVKAAQ